MLMMREQALSIEEAAQVLNLHPDTVRRMIKRGEIQASKVGRQYRIRQAEIDRILGGSSQPEKEEQ